MSTSIQKRLGVALAGMLAVALTIGVSVAYAAMTSPDSDHVTHIEYCGAGNGACPGGATSLLIQLVNGVNYLADEAAGTTGPAGSGTCNPTANQSQATIERWQELATAALLSGHQLNISYCTQSNVTPNKYWITAVDLMRD